MLRLGRLVACASEREQHGPHQFVSSLTVPPTVRVGVIPDWVRVRPRVGRALGDDDPDCGAGRSGTQLDEAPRHRSTVARVAPVGVGPARPYCVPGRWSVVDE